MPRPPRIEANENGSVSLRIEVGPSTWTLIQAYAKRLGITDAQATRALLLYVEALVSEDQLSWLTLDWQHASKAFREARGGLPPGLAGIDVTKLHRSERTKSGFVGVYANGEGFRAAGRRGETIGTFRTAEEAAARRYLHYKQNGLPYGELELEIARLRETGEQGSDDELKDIALTLASHMGDLHRFKGCLTPEEYTAAQTQPMGFAGISGLEAAQAKLRERDATEEAAERGGKRRGRPPKTKGPPPKTKGPQT